MPLGDDRLAALGVPLPDAGYGPLHDLDIAVFGIGGDTPEKVGDEQRTAIPALPARVEVMNGCRRIVDVGLDLLPQLRGTLFVRFQGFLVPLNSFECPLAPLAKRLVLVAVGVLRLFVAPVVEACIPSPGLPCTMVTFPKERWLL